MCAGLTPKHAVKLSPCFGFSLQYIPQIFLSSEQKHIVKLWVGVGGGGEGGVQSLHSHLGCKHMLYLKPRFWLGF